MKKINGNLILKKLYKDLAKQIADEACKIVDDASKGDTDALYVISNGPWEVMTFATIRAEEKAKSKVRRRKRELKNMIAELEAKI